MALHPVCHNLSFRPKEFQGRFSPLPARSGHFSLAPNHTCTRPYHPAIRWKEDPAFRKILTNCLLGSNRRIFVPDDRVVLHQRRPVSAPAQLDRNEAVGLERRRELQGKVIEQLLLMHGDDDLTAMLLR